MSSLFPLAQTPMSREGAQEYNTMARKIKDALLSMTPWKKRRQGLVSEEMRKKVGSGNVVVFLEAGENSTLELYQEATTLRDS